MFEENARPQFRVKSLDQVLELIQDAQDQGKPGRDFWILGAGWPLRLHLTLMDSGRIEVLHKNWRVEYFTRTEFGEKFGEAIERGEMHTHEHIPLPPAVAEARAWIASRRAR